jgi:hypothetical protein
MARTDCGSPPVRLLFRRSNSVRLLSPPSSGGMLPCSRLLLRSSLRSPLRRSGHLATKAETRSDSSRSCPPPAARRGGRYRASRAPGPTARSRTARAASASPARPARAARVWLGCSLRVRGAERRPAAPGRGAGGQGRERDESGLNNTQSNDRLVVDGGKKEPA